MKRPKPYSVWMYQILGLPPETTKQSVVVRPAWLVSQHVSEDAARRAAKEHTDGGLMQAPTNVMEMRGPDIPVERWIRGDSATLRDSQLRGRSKPFPFFGEVIVSLRPKHTVCWLPSGAKHPMRSKPQTHRDAEAMRARVTSVCTQLLPTEVTPATKDTPTWEVSYGDRPARMSVIGWVWEENGELHWEQGNRPLWATFVPDVIGPLSDLWKAGKVQRDTLDKQDFGHPGYHILIRRME